MNLFRLFRRQPKAYLICANGTQWAKAVVYGRPKWPFVIGPFRSEIDAEDTADFLNSERPNPLYYDSEHAEAVSVDGDDDDDDGEGWKKGQGADH